MSKTNYSGPLDLDFRQSAPSKEKAVASPNVPRPTSTFEIWWKTLLIGAVIGGLVTVFFYSQWSGTAALTDDRTEQSGEDVDYYIQLQQMKRLHEQRCEETSSTKGR